MEAHDTSGGTVGGPGREVHTGTQKEGPWEGSGSKGWTHLTEGLLYLYTGQKDEGRDSQRNREGAPYHPTPPEDPGFNAGWTLGLALPSLDPGQQDGIP